MRMRNVDTERFIDGLHEYLERAFKPVAERLKAMEQRLERLEAGQKAATPSKARKPKGAA